MKIAFLVRSLGCGGAERQLVQLATHLSQRHEVSIMTFYPGDDFFRVDVEKAAVRLTSLGKNGRWDVFPFVVRFLTEIVRLKPDVIYAFMNTAGLVSLAARLTRVSPHIVWGIRSSNMDLRKYGALSRVLRRLESMLSPCADLVIANSEAGKAQAIKDGFGSNILVVPNGIDTSRFVRNEEAGRRLRREQAIPESASLIGIVARHDPMKGYDTFLRAAALYLNANSAAHFISIGDGNQEYTDRLKRMAEDMGVGNRILWVARTEDIALYYSAMDVFASSSSFGEGFSNAIGEAMACGVPCVVTDVGDSRLIVGDTGLVVPPNSPEALSKGWRTMCNLPADVVRSHRAAARNRIVNEFSEARMVTLTESALVAMCSS